MSKLGRNDTCPCGSGKKYKKCCAKLQDEQRKLKQEMVKKGFPFALANTTAQPGSNLLLKKMVKVVKGQDAESNLAKRAIENAENHDDHHDCAHGCDHHH